jgi:phage-related protein
VTDRDIVWVGSSYKDLVSMPAEIQHAFGYALELAQRGLKAGYAKQMRGDLRDVTEIIAGDDTGKSTYRGMYTATIGDAVYVLDVFQKKSKSGIATPRRDLDRIRQRFGQAKEHHEEEQRRARKD